VAAPGGVLSAAATVLDPGSGAGATVPAGTRVTTYYAQYDTNGDGVAERFAITVAAISAMLLSVTQASADGGSTFYTVELIGGAAFEPADARFSNPAQLALPVSAQTAVGTAVDVLWFNNNMAVSQAGGYWELAGGGVVTLAGSKHVVSFATQRFGVYAVTLPHSSNHPPTISSISATPFIVGLDEVVALACTATNPDGDTLGYVWSGDGTFTGASSSDTEWSSSIAGNHILTCAVSDNQGHVVRGEVVVTVTAGANLPPVITSVTADPTTVEPDATTTLTCTANDPDGDTLSYTWSGTGSFGDTAAATTTWSHDTVGTHTLTCTVHDGQGHQVSRDVNVTVELGAANQPPEITAMEAVPASVEIGVDSTLTCTATDPDSDTMGYAWTGEGTFADALAASTTWHHNTPGVFTLTCTVDDGQGNQASDTVDVEVTAPPDTEPPAWDGGDAGLVVDAREGFVLVTFNSATDAGSAPVGYTLYYAETAVFDVATASQSNYASYPTVPVRIDGLALGTDYTFGVIATDSADTPNSTALVTTVAMPVPYYADVPAGGHDFPAAAKFYDIAVIEGRERALTVAWADPLSGALRHSYYTDGSWVVRDIPSARNYVLVQVEFRDGLPVLVSADYVGNVDVLQQGTDGLWATTTVFVRAGVHHVVLHALMDEASGTLYIAHATESPGPPPEQMLHFLALDMSSNPPSITDQIDDYSTQPYIGRVLLRYDDAGDLAMVFNQGDGSYSFPNWLGTELVFATYDAGTGFTSEVASGFTPLFFDVHAAAGGGWELVITHGEMTLLGGEDFVYFILQTATGEGTTWDVTDIFTEELILNGQVISYDAPLECVWSPTPGGINYSRGSGDIDLQVIETTASLALWSVEPPAPSTLVPGETLAQVVTIGSPNNGFLLAAEMATFAFADITSQLDFPGGNLVLLELP
jgi:hypothetical protein